MNTSDLYHAWTTAPTPKMARKGAYDPGRAIYMGEMGGCERKATLRLLRYPAAPFTPGTQDLMNNGLLWEDFICLLWEQQAQSQNMPMIRQQPVQSPFGNGKMDVWLPALNHIVEVKATESKGRNYLPKNEHLNQVTLYQGYYEHYSVNAHRPSAEIVYCLRDTREVLTFPVPFDAARLARLQEWGGRVQHAVWRRTPLPIPEPNAPDRFPCDWGHGQCQFYRHCWQEEAADETPGDQAGSV